MESTSTLPHHSVHPLLDGDKKLVQMKLPVALYAELGKYADANGKFLSRVVAEAILQKISGPTTD